MFAFLLLLDASLLSQADVTHYSQLLTLQHSTVFFFSLKISLDRLKTEMGKISNFTDSKWFKTPKMDCALKVYQDKEFY